MDKDAIFLEQRFKRYEEYYKKAIDKEKLDRLILRLVMDNYNQSTFSNLEELDTEEKKYLQ